MTVELPEDQPSSARCFWFNINGDLQKGTFKHTMLVKKDPPKEKSGGMTWG